MRSGTGFFLSMGVGLGVAKWAGDDWWWQGLLGILLITLMHIVTKSDLYIDSIEQCKTHEVDFSLIKFSSYTTISSGIIALITFAIIRLIF